MHERRKKVWSITLYLNDQVGTAPQPSQGTGMMNRCVEIRNIEHPLSVISLLEKTKNFQKQNTNIISL